MISFMWIISTPFGSFCWFLQSTVAHLYVKSTGTNIFGVGKEGMVSIQETLTNVSWRGPFWWYCGCIPHNPAEQNIRMLLVAFTASLQLPFNSAGPPNSKSLPFPQCLCQTLQCEHTFCLVRDRHQIGSNGISWTPSV